MGGEWEIFRNSSNSEEFDEDQSEEIETQGKLSHHRIRVHAIRIRKSEEHAILKVLVNVLVTIKVLVLYALCWKR